MAKLKGSIRKEYKISGSIKRIFNVTGSAKKIYSLLGSVETFVRSLFIRIFINPVFNMSVKIMADRYMKANINPEAEVKTRFSVDKNMKNILFISKASLAINTKATRNFKFDIVSKPIFGKDTSLELIDGLSLNEMDVQTLEELEFTEGVFVNIVKSTSFNILSIFEVTSDTYIIRLTTLEALDDLTIDSMDDLSLNEIEETEV